MTALSDIALPQINVLDSTMAYREAGNPKHGWTLFCRETQPRRTDGEISFRWLRRLRLCIAPDLVSVNREESP